jgi:hypothetical protein
VTGNADHRQPLQTILDLDLQKRPRRGCFRLPPRLLIFILFSLYVYSLVSLLWSVYIVKPLYYYSSVLKSTLFTPNSFPLSFLSVLDHSYPSEIRTFRCYEGTAYKLRPSPFRIYLRSLESVILLPEPNSISKLQLVPYSLWKLGQR